MTTARQPGGNRIIICGSGIAGVATAWALTREKLDAEVVLIDRATPLSLTTAVSGENFRNFWPQAPMRALSEHSIQLMREMKKQGADFKLHFSGYEFISNRDAFDLFDLDEHDVGQVTRVTDRQTLGESRPYLAPDVALVVRAMNAGSLDVHALGSWMLKRALNAGVTQIRSEIVAITRAETGFRVYCRDHRGEENTYDGSRLVIAAGPFSRLLAQQLGVDLPLYNVIQRKCVIPDPANVIPANMPFTIVADPQFLPMTDEERRLLSRDPEFAWLTEAFPPGLHIKPEPGGRIKLGWAFNTEPCDPAWEIAHDDLFPEIVLRGASRYFPGLARYVAQVPTPITPLAGQYCRTAENWPLVGPLPVEGAFTVSGLSGFGTMMAAACGSLCSAWVTGNAVPDYARYFHPARYDDADILGDLSKVASDGQL
jgi:glycine/D-amino acid oxidase-like deaminating enzyme